jgi:hypothetical protein
MAPGRRVLQKIQMGKEMVNGTPAVYFTRARVAGGMLSDDRSINMVQEMLGIIPSQERSYVSAATGSISLGGTPLSPQQLPIHTANSLTGETYGVPSAAVKSLMTPVAATLAATAGSTTITVGTATSPISVRLHLPQLQVLLQHLSMVQPTLLRLRGQEQVTTPFLPQINNLVHIRTMSRCPPLY